MRVESRRREPAGSGRHVVASSPPPPPARACFSDWWWVWVEGKRAVEAGHEPAIRAHRPGVGTTGTPAASDDTATGWPLAGSPPGPQRHLVPGPHRGALARPARAVWALGDGLQAVRALADRRHLGPHRGHVADPGRRGWGA